MKHVNISSFPQNKFILFIQYTISIYNMYNFIKVMYICKLSTYYFTYNICYITDLDNLFSKLKSISNIPKYRGMWIVKKINKYQDWTKIPFVNDMILQNVNCLNFYLLILMKLKFNNIMTIRSLPYSSNS